MTLPTNSPRKVSPVCQRLKPWLLPKTSGKACDGVRAFIDRRDERSLGRTPKNRYSTPNKTADKRHRLVHIG